INAYSLPTGRLYITRGLLALDNDRSELAAVVAHEIAHVCARHATIRADVARQIVQSVVAGPQAGAMAFDRSTVALATFSKNQELEADSIGIRIAADAGYDPH